MEEKIEWILGIDSFGCEQTSGSTVELGQDRGIYLVLMFPSEYNFMLLQNIVYGGGTRLSAKF